MGTECAIHCNTRLAHQVEAARVLREGFKRHGINATITQEKTCDAGFHVCMGPWFALRENIGKRVLYLDRAYWGNPGAVSLSWLDSEGAKVFGWGQTEKRPHPPLKPHKGLKTAVVLCDYGMDGVQERNCALPLFKSVEIRRHPSEKPSGESLEDCLGSHGIAIGRHSTAMVQAAIEGLAVVCKVPNTPVSPIAGITCRDIRHPSREQWINDLAWHNWTLEEIENGDAWQHLDHSS